MKESSTNVRDTVVEQSEEPLSRVLLPEDVGAILGISRNTTYQLLHSENFPAFKVGKLYRVPRDEFLLWMESQTANKTLN